MRISYAGYTHRGNYKANNEDNFYLEGMVKGEDTNTLLASGKCRDTAVFAVSDGISDMLEDREILAVLQNHASPEKACIALVNRAMEYGRTDNLTAVVVSIE